MHLLTHHSEHDAATSGVVVCPSCWTQLRDGYSFLYLPIHSPSSPLSPALTQRSIVSDHCYCKTQNHSRSMAKFRRFFKGHLPQLQQAEQAGSFFYKQLGEWYVACLYLNFMSSG